MENAYPWLDKPIETWTWDECKAEYLRLGFETYDDINYDNCKSEEEKNRLQKIVFRVLDDEVWNARWSEIKQVLRQAHIL